MATTYHNPDNETPIDTVYVYLSVDANGNHGVMAGMIPGVGAVQLIAGSLRNAEHMRPAAQEAARATGKRAALFAFKRGEQLWEFDPRH